MFRCFASLILGLALSMAGIPGQAEEKVALQLKWVHAYQFAGYYLAKEKGFYREEGLDVEIREGWPGIDFVDEVLSGRAQYGTGSSGLLLDRNRGRKVVVLAVVFQHSPDVLITASASGITTPKQLLTKRVMTSFSTPAVAAMLINEAGTLDQFDILDQTDDLQALMEARLDAVAGYITDQPYFFRRQGFPVNLIRPLQYGVDFYGDNLFTSERELRKHPDRARAFRRASLRGWEYALRHPDESIAIIQRYGSTRTTEHLRYEYEAMWELILPELVDMGTMNPGRWRHIADTYIRLGLMREEYSLEGFLYDPAPGIDPEKFRKYGFIVLGGSGFAMAVILVLLRFNRRLQREIRERRQAEARLAEQESYLRAIFDNEPECIKLLDAEGRLLDMNPAGLAMIEAPSLEAVRGQPVCGLMAPKDRPKFREMLEAVFRGESRFLVFEALGFKGTRRHLETHSVPLWDAERRKVRALLGVTRDVTERQRAESKLRLLAAVVESTRDGVLVTDGRGSIVAVNRAFTDITGYSEAEALSRKPAFRFSEHHDRRFYRNLWASIRKTGGWQGEIWNRRKEGGIYPEWLTVSEVRDSEGRVVNYVGVFSDISQIKQSQLQLEHLAHHDTLTGLPNRLLFNARLEQALRRTERYGVSGAVMFLDLDRFKQVNDSLGHRVGDELLRQVAARLGNLVRGEDTVARLGGDEFIVLLEGLRESGDAALLADKVIRALAQPFEVEGHQLFIGVSVGISVFPDDGHTVEQLLRNADSAMYRAKEQGRNGYRFYTEEMTAQALEHLVLQGELRRAIENGELELYYQPQVCLGDGRLVGLEGLLRWPHRERGFIPPSRFIAMAEECGLILPLGDWVLRTACRQGRQWLDRGLAFGRISVNIAGQQIQQGSLFAGVRQILAETGLPPHHLELEITETFVMKEAERAIGLLNAIRELGVTLAIDDFGTGYSSLACLKRLPVHKLKIDKSFVHDLPHDENDAAISRAVIALGHSLQFTVIAEGVETEAQFESLRRDGCDQVQGFLVGRPMPADRVPGFLRSFGHWNSDLTGRDRRQAVPG